MTVLDKNVEYKPLIMVVPRKKLSLIPLESPYRYSDYKESFYEPWVRLQCEVGLFETEEEARKALDSFLPNIDQFVFVTNEKNELVASAGLWEGTHFDTPRLRIHYVAVSEKDQHKGIGASMITKLSAMYDHRPSKYPLYLVTQTNSYGAIALYSRMGFNPYFGEYKGCSEEENKKNWELATQILREKATQH